MITIYYNHFYLSIYLGNRRVNLWYNPIKAIIQNLFIKLA